MHKWEAELEAEQWGTLTCVQIQDASNAGEGLLHHRTVPTDVSSHSSIHSEVSNFQLECLDHLDLMLLLITEL